MDPYSFPAAIVASWIICVVLIIGVKLARKENETGIEPKAATPFIFGCIGIGCIFFYFNDVPFIYQINSDLIGAAIGIGSAYFVMRLVCSLKQARNQ